MLGAIALSNPTRAPEIYLVERREWERATHMPSMGLREGDLSSPYPARYESFDGVQVPVFVYEPRRGGRPYPTVVWVSRGPEWQERYAFNSLVQLLAYRGFLVLAPNVRGSTGYGKKYAHRTTSREDGCSEGLRESS